MVVNAVVSAFGEIEWFETGNAQKTALDRHTGGAKLRIS